MELQFPAGSLRNNFNTGFCGGSILVVATRSPCRGNWFAARGRCCFNYRATETLLESVSAHSVVKLKRSPPHRAKLGWEPAGGGDFAGTQASNVAQRNGHTLGAGAEAASVYPSIRERSRYSEPMQNNKNKQTTDDPISRNSADVTVGARQCGLPHSSTAHLVIGEVHMRNCRGHHVSRNPLAEAWVKVWP